MTNKDCGQLPAIDLSGLNHCTSKREKLRLFASLFKCAPKSVGSQLKRVVNDTPVDELIPLLAKAHSMYVEVCCHAALATLLEPSLAMAYAIALNKTPSQDHNMIFATLMQSQENREENVYLLLAEIDRIGLCNAVVDALERDRMPVFGVTAAPGKNNNPSAPYVKKFLLRLLLSSTDTSTRLIAVKWLPFFTSTKAECLSLINQNLHDEDENIRAIGALQLSNVIPESPEVQSRLWKTMQDSRWNDRQLMIFNGERADLAMLVLKRIVDRPFMQLTREEQLEMLTQNGVFWCGQINSTDPVNRDVVEKNVRRLYEAAGCAAPHTVLWFKNPRMVAIAATLLETAIRPDSESDGWNPLSKVQRYIGNLEFVIKRFPDLVQGSLSPWPFGPNGWRISEEQPFAVGSARMLNGGHWQQQLHPWSAISGCTNELPNEVANAWDRLQHELSSKMELLVSRVDPDPALLDKSRISSYMSILLDHVRLGMVGYRSILKAIGACPDGEDGLEEILQNCGGFIPFENVVIAIERPYQINRDSQDRLHNLMGKSIEYEDGWGVYSVCGVSVVPHLITDPSKLTVAEVESQWSAEVSRIMIDRYGVERFIQDCGTEVIDQSEYGVLYCKRTGRSPFAMVKVINRSPEPDGSFKTYFLEVPPTMTTARAAIAWTFEMEESEYSPIVET